MLKFVIIVMLAIYGILELDGIRKVMYDTYTKQYLTKEDVNK